MLKRSAFGRRQQVAAKTSDNATPQASIASRPRVQGADDDGVRRALPKSLWEGDHGDMLRGLGLSPDDPWNVMATPPPQVPAGVAASVPPPYGLPADLEGMREEQVELVARVNAELPFGIEVLPWPMLPHTLWAGRHAGFLLSMGLRPVGPWNTMMLAANQVSAATLGLPERPRELPAGLERTADRLIDGLGETLAEIHRRSLAKLTRGDLSGLGDFESELAACPRKVAAIAQGLAADHFGMQAFEHHRQLFGAMLGWEAAAA